MASFIKSRASLVLGVLLLASVVGVVFSWESIAGRLGRVPDEPAEQTVFMMDTYVTIKAWPAKGVDPEKAIARALEEMSKVDRLMSVTREGSDVWRINHEAGKGAVAVSDDTFIVVGKALEFARMSQGRFDITVGPLVKLWGFYDRNFAVPSEDRLRDALGKVDFHKVEIDPQAKTVRLAEPGMALDLGGIAKGYAVDLGAKALREAGVKRAVIDAGGNLYTIGERPGGGPWRIGIRHPRATSETIGPRVALSDGAVATSGDYERYFEEGGVRYHHILDPKTGYPGRKAISVTVVAKSAAAADALSTVLFLLGPDDGQRFLEEHKELSAEALFVMSDLSMTSTRGFPALEESEAK